MDKYSLSHTPHITRFLKLLKENVPGLNDSELHGVNYVSIKEKTGKDAEELLNLCTLTWYNGKEIQSNSDQTEEREEWI